MTDTNQASQQPLKKAGRTLLVKPTSENQDYSFLDQIEGLQSKHLTEKTGSYFLTFESQEHSLAAYHELKNNHSSVLKVKYAHYRVFFTLSGLTNESDYNTVKTNHIQHILDSVNGNVLYYKLYRRNNSYLECGDLTLDTKESFDMLVSKESEHKSFTLDDNLTGVHYRYNKKTSSTTTTNMVASN